MKGKPSSIYKNCNSNLKQVLSNRKPLNGSNIPKAGGGTRPLGIPTVKDRVVQMAIKRVIEPIFEQTFRDSSHGFRLERGCKDALREVDVWLKAGYNWVVDADIKGYFDNISHELMMNKVEQHIADKALLNLLEAYLKQDIMVDGESCKANKGAPQGTVLSSRPKITCTNQLLYSYSDKFCPSGGCMTAL